MAKNIYLLCLKFYVMVHFVLFGRNTAPIAKSMIIFGHEKYGLMNYDSFMENIILPNKSSLTTLNSILLFQVFHFPARYKKATIKMPVSKYPLLNTGILLIASVYIELRAILNM